MVSERIRPLNAAGFGLGELAVTLALVAVVTAVATPSLVASWRVATLRAAAEELAVAVNLGRQLAIAHNAPVCIAIADADVRFEGTSGGVCSGVGLPGAVPVHLAGGLTVRAVGGGVVFTGLGAATPAGRYVVAGPAGSGTRSVVVAASGRVSIQ
jgi:type II secretory pathway pseudopilin PulG